MSTLANPSAEAHAYALEKIDRWPIVQRYRSEQEGVDVAQALREKAAAPDTLYDNASIGDKSKAILALEAYEDALREYEGEALSAIAQQLHSSLAPPVSADEPFLDSSLPLARLLMSGMPLPTAQLSTTLMYSLYRDPAAVAALIEPALNAARRSGAMLSLLHQLKAYQADVHGPAAAVSSSTEESQGETGSQDSSLAQAMDNMGAPAAAAASASAPTPVRAGDADMRPQHTNPELNGLQEIVVAGPQSGIVGHEQARMVAELQQQMLEMRRLLQRQQAEAAPAVVLAEGPSAEQRYEQAKTQYVFHFGQDESQEAHEALVLFSRHHQPPYTKEQLQAVRNQLYPPSSAAPRHHAQPDGMFGASSSAAPQHAAVGSSPHPDALLRWADAKQIAASKFSATILAPKEKEINALRAEVDALNGILRPSDPAYQQIANKAIMQFARDGNGVRMMEKRANQLEKKQGEFNSLMTQMASLRRQMSEVRLLGQILETKVRQDQAEYRRQQMESRNDVQRKQEEMERQLRERREREEAKLQRRAAQLSYTFQPLQQSRFTHTTSARRFIDDEAEEDNGDMFD